MSTDLRLIASQFRVYGDFLEARPYGSGHINDTYAIRLSQGGSQIRYIVQRINHTIFTNVPKLMENIGRVTRHVAGKLRESGAMDVARRTMTVIPTNEGQDYHRDQNGDFWRMYIFIEAAKTYDTIEQTEQAYEAAKAFGEFQRMLVDVPEPPLFETIPDFHNGPKRFLAFQDALRADTHNRATDCKAEIAFLEKHAWIFDVLPRLVESGEVPVRVTHNDTKINNVMLDNATGEGLCVIDLDTVMPGLALYDFGDIVRTSTSPTKEDERDLSKVGMVMSQFEAIARGYLETAGAFLNSVEKENLVLGGKMITLTIGIRFLTDYLAGDTYFKTHRQGHNLDRCRTQFRLIQSITEQEEAMNRFVAGY